MDGVVSQQILPLDLRHHQTCLGRSIRRQGRSRGWGVGDEMQVNEPHPDTAAPIVGTRIPCWDELLNLVCRVSRVFAGLRTQSWDVAPTDRGPVLLEVNFGGDLNLAQLAYGTGVLDDAFAAHLSRCGYRLPKP